MLLAEKVFNDMELVKLPIKQHLSLLHKKQGNKISKNDYSGNIG